MELNLILVCVGLIICFGGIYLRKLVAGATGFLWGALLSAVFILVYAILAGNIWNFMRTLDDPETFYAIIGCAVVSCILSALFDRICVAISTFSISNVIVILWAIFNINDTNDLTGFLFVSVIISFVIAVLAYAHYDYSFVLVTAFSGAFMANIGGMGLVAECDALDVLLMLMNGRNSSVFFVVLMGTFILGVLGCIVQHKRIRARMAEQTGMESNSATTSKGVITTAPLEHTELPRDES